MRLGLFVGILCGSLLFSVSSYAQSSQKNSKQRVQSVALHIENVSPESALNCSVANQIRMTNAMLNGGDIAKAKKYAFRSKVWTEVRKSESDKSVKALVDILGDGYLLKGIGFEEMRKPSKSTVKKAKKVDKKCKKFAQGYKE